MEELESKLLQELSDLGAQIEIDEKILERRDLFAAAALTGILTSLGNTGTDPSDMVRASWKLADIMLEMESEPTPSSTTVLPFHGD